MAGGIVSHWIHVEPGILLRPNLGGFSRHFLLPVTYDKNQLPRFLKSVLREQPDTFGANTREDACSSVLPFSATSGCQRKEPPLKPPSESVELALFMTERSTVT